MGGFASAVSDSTIDIFLESAFFKPTVIAGRARRHGLMTDASYRFERGVDPELCHHAIAWATHWLLTICGGQAGPLINMENQSHLPTHSEVDIRMDKVTRLLGIELPSKMVLDFFTGLGIRLVSPLPENTHGPSLPFNSQICRVKAPSWRFDLNEEVDFIEEAIRLYGYDRIPTQQPYFPIVLQAPTDDRRMLERCRNFWMDQGYHETVHYSFTSFEHQQLLDPKQSPVHLENPISKELNVLRTNLWPGLINTLVHNRNYQQKAVYLFEIGTVFFMQPEGICEEPHMGGIASGQVLAEQWGICAREIDFFDVKQSIHNSFSVLDAHHAYTYIAEAHPALHPSQSGRIYRDKKPIGWIGALHPQLYDHFDVTGPLYLFEWQLASPLKSSVPIFQPFSRFPLMRRDLAFWMPNNLSFADIESVIRTAAGEYLKDLTLFDVYHPKEQTGQRSIALGLIWQHPTRTLTDTEVDEWQANIVDTLLNQYDIELRG
jgi:phenylalanyl-tRNA synthetase beta chain